MVQCVPRVFVVVVRSFVFLALPFCRRHARHCLWPFLSLFPSPFWSLVVSSVA